MCVRILRLLLGLFLTTLPVAGAAAGASLADVTPGTTNRAQMAELFGEPLEAAGALREVFEATEKGFARLAVQYDASDTVQRAEFVFARSFTPDQVELLFALRSRSARSVEGFDLGGAEAPIAALGVTHHYDADGLSFYALDGRVVSLVLVDPDRQEEQPSAPVTLTPPDGPDPTGADPAGISRRLPDFVQTPSPTGDALQTRAAAAARDGRLVRLLSVGAQSDARFHEHPSLLVVAGLQAEGLKGELMTVEVRPTLLDGTPVRAASGTPSRHVRPDGSFVLNLEDRVEHDAAQWSPWRAYIVHDWLDLPAGPHELILHIAATCGDASSRSLISRKLELP